MVYVNKYIAESITLCYTIIVRDVISDYYVEWDDDKNITNQKKHGISFYTAALVFADENRIEYYDELHSIEEDRYVVIGCVRDIIFVIYTMREESVRLISARIATPTERKVYYGEYEG